MTVNRMYQYCLNCYFYEWDENIILSNGKVAHPGHCGLWSGQCINSVHSDSDKVPPNFLHMEEVYAKRDTTVV